MQRPLRNRLHSDGVVLVELWNPVVVEGFVEYGLSGHFATPVSLIPTDTKKCRLGHGAEPLEYRTIRDYANCGIHDDLDPGLGHGIDDVTHPRVFEMAVLGSVSRAVKGSDIRFEHPPCAAHDV